MILMRNLRGKRRSINQDRNFSEASYGRLLNAESSRDVWNLVLQLFEEEHGFALGRNWLAQNVSPELRFSDHGTTVVLNCTTASVARRIDRDYLPNLEQWFAQALNCSPAEVFILVEAEAI